MRWGLCTDGCQGWVLTGVGSLDLRREIRYDIQIWGKYRRGRGSATAVQLFNLSEYGCQFRGLWGRLEEGATLTLKIGSIGPINAHVVWIDGASVGIEFADPLHPSVMAHIIDNMDERGADAQDLDQHQQNQQDANHAAKRGVQA